MLDGIEPVRIGPRFLQQPVARTQRPIKRVDPACMLGDRPPAPGDRENVAAPTARRRTANPSPAPARRRAGDQRKPKPKRPARDRSGRCAYWWRRLRVCARCRCRAWRAPARLRLRRRPPRSRHPRGMRPPRAWRGAGRGRARETRSLRSDWFCRRRSARTSTMASASACKRCRMVVAEIGQGQAAGASHRRLRYRSDGRRISGDTRLAISDLPISVRSDLRHTRIGIST